MIMDIDPPRTLGLGDLLAPMSEEAFFSGVHGKDAVHIEGAADKFDFAMTWDAMSGLLNQTALWTAATLELYLDTQRIPPQEYTTAGHTRVGSQAPTVNLDRVRHWIRHGASIVLNDIQSLTPGMKDISRTLADRLGGKVQANLYCSWRAHQAFGVHFDTHDVFAMQIAGVKRWRIYQRPISDPINHPSFKNLDRAFHERNHGPLSHDFLMKPGDMIYVPRGFYHEALAESDATMHISFGIVPVIGLDLLTALFERAVHDDLFRQAVPNPDVDEKATRQHLIKLSNRIGKLLQDKEFQANFNTAIRDYRYPMQQIKLPDDAFGDS